MAIRFALLLLVGSLATTRFEANALLVPSPASTCLDPSSAHTVGHGRNINPTTATIRSQHGSHYANSMTSTALRADGGNNNNNNNNNNNDKKKPDRAKGVYVRPSGAIEQGSGFFVPGLEGPKVRLVIGLVLLAATGVNHFVLTTYGGSGGGSGEGLSFSESIAVFYSVLLLFQFAIEYAKEVFLPSAATASGSGAAAKRKLQDSFAAAAAATEVLEQQWSSVTSSGGNGAAAALDDGDEEDDEEDYRSKVQWAAASYLSMTPTTQIMLLASDEQNGNGNGGTIRYRLGGSESDRGGGETVVGAGVKAALDELKQSKGGRISLPLTHPAVQALLPNESELSTDGEDDQGTLRTVILQRITDGSCWMASSDQLLAGYTPGDLKWLGRLADYVRV